MRAALTYVSGALGFGPLSRRRLGRPDAIIDVGNGIPFLSKAYARKPVLVLVHHVHREQWPVVMGRLKAKFGWWIESRLAIRVFRKCRYVTVSEATRRELVGLGVQAGRINIVTMERIFGAHHAARSGLAAGARAASHKRVEIAIATWTCAPFPA
jgi:hypothetical protein